ncbi:GMC family oxidoreductase N-terminal domain-containing protein [Bradyrhizobium sp. Ai1a-2]|uniref:GMC family oxidoreductase n=1 Tax=Bradyrhizobium sp. Ai1a-2 TaxID=196490 RepID=UPI000A00C82E|nr:GMC family oxidoreductase N-terminal domain-containing protein [Bradyrhizobium sp. Ai1a-2]
MNNEFSEVVRVNQQRLGANLRQHYDFIVCGSGSSGSVVARRLAEDENVSVLLLEAGGEDDHPSVTEAGAWPTNLGSERDWGFKAEPDARLNGRSIPLSMGKVLGGGSSVNAMIWSRGHKSDWDFFASEAGDEAWSYQSVLGIYRRIEDWHGAPDPKYRGTGGIVFVQPAQDPTATAPAILEGCRSTGIPIFENQNGRMMEGEAGASIMDVRVHNGKRQSVFRSYVFPYMDRPNLTVLAHAVVNRIVFDGKRAAGIEISHLGAIRRIDAGCEIVLSCGAFHTPTILMQSGIGDRGELQRFGIPLVQHLPGVGANFQDHVGFDCVWETYEPLPRRNNGVEATFFCRSSSELDYPDIQVCVGSVAKTSAENAARFSPPSNAFTLFGGLVRPRSRGRIRLTGSHPGDPLQIEANFLSHPDDMKAAITCVDVCRELGNSAAMRPFRKREVLPGDLNGEDMEDFIRDAASTYWHQTCTAKMGRDDMSVVDAKLNVYGIDRLRIADGSIMPRVTIGNTMAPCIIIGERAGHILQSKYGLRVSLPRTA